MATNRGRYMAPTLAALALLLMPATPLQAQTSACQFVLGFKALHDLDPTDVGDCTDNQTLAASSGDQQQHTTKGLLVWRKLDNWTAFTDGYWAWINGPSGLAQRLNTQRFSWEANPDNLPLADGGSPAPASSAPAPAATAAPAAAPTVAPTPIPRPIATPAPYRYGY